MDNVNKPIIPVKEEKLNENGIAPSPANAAGSGIGISGAGDNADLTKPLAQFFKKKQLRQIIKRK